MHRLRLLVACLLAAVALPLAITATADAAAKRVVALEWDSLEGLVSMGVTPVGAADLGGYRTWVGLSVPSGIQDVGSRQAPSLERIASLRPDLIVVTQQRAARNLSQLRKIAPVLITDPYARGKSAADAQFRAMVHDYRRIANAVGRRDSAEVVLKRMSDSFATLRGRLRKERLSGIPVTIAFPGGTTSAPALRLSTSNSLAAEVVRQLGMRNGWNGRPETYGFTQVSPESLRQVQNGWAAFVYPTQYASQVRAVQRQSWYRSLDMVRKRHVRNIDGRTWLYGGPVSTQLFAERLAAAVDGPG